MPSEIIIPGFTAVILLLMIGLSIAGVISASLSLTVNALRESYENYQRRLNRIVIQRITLGYVDGVLTGEILVYNDGSQPIYRMSSCDLIIEYHSASSVFKSVRLNYSAEWFVEKIYLVDDYGVEFGEHPSIGQGESGLIRISALVDDIDASKPVRVVFTTHFGATSSRWVMIDVKS